MDPIISASAPSPIARSVMLQRWQTLTFLHWAYPADVLQTLIPRGLKVHTYDGKAWVGLTPFLLDRLRLPFTPAVPWLSRFPEMNVRTYVIGPDGRPGVWFFTLEASRLAAVLAARSLYGLPYRWARMSVREHGGIMQYRSRRKRSFGRGKAVIDIQPGRGIRSETFDNFLTGRYRLYSVMWKRLVCADIDHQPWSLHEARVLRLEQDVIEACGLPTPQGDPVVHFSRTLDVRIGPLRRV